jgi:DNA-binding transcriptional ArsR family regulator
MDTDADLAVVAGLIGDPARARVLAALGDGRALAASVLAAEAGVSPSTVSGHLGKLVDAGILTVTPQGRHRYYRLAGPEVGEALEALARIAPPAPVRSLKEGTRAHAVRRARTCYDHLAGRLGVAVLAGLIERGAIVGHDGRHLPSVAGRDRLSSPGWDVDYRLGEGAGIVLDSLGVDLDALLESPRRRPLLRYCVDWSEQRHHLAGALGAGLLDAFLRSGWLRRARAGRAVHLTDEGERALSQRLGVSLADPLEGQCIETGTNAASSR